MRNSADPARRRSRLRIAALLAVVLALLTACAEDAPLDTLDPAGPAAEEIDNLFTGVFLVATVVFVLVQGGIFYILFRYRRKRGDSDEPPTQTHGNLKLELGWTILPAVILVFVAVFTVSTVFSLEERDPDAVPVLVSGQQWWWQYTYEASDLIEAGLIPNDEYAREAIITSTEMVIPVDRQMDLSIIARDVIHSFWIPRLNGKRDAVPGRTHTLSMEASELGEFLGNCAEFCGLSHARMRMSVRAVPNDVFTEWAVDQLGGATRPESPSAAALRGWETFRSVCSSCHLIQGTTDSSDPDQGWGNEDLYDPTSVNQEAGIAPDLTHLMTRPRIAGGVIDLFEPNPDGTVPFVGQEPRVLNRTGLEAWLKDPPAIKAMDPEPSITDTTRGERLLLPRGMPDLNLTDEQVDDLVAYLETLD